MRIHHQIRRAAQTFRDGTKGNVSIEFVLWMPLFFMMILFTADISLIFMRQSSHRNVSHDTARILSRHGMTVTEAIIYVKNETRSSGYTPKVDIQVTDSTVTVSVIANAKQMAPFGTLGFALGETVTTRVKHTMEPI